MANRVPRNVEARSASHRSRGRDVNERGRDYRRFDGRRVVAGLVLVTVVALALPVTIEGRRAWSAARSPLATGAPVVMQSRAQGCGAALLATLLARHGLEGNELALLEAAPPGPNGISLATFSRLAYRFGLEGAWRRASPTALPAPGFVAHLHRPRGHFVFVEARAGDYLHVLDPDAGAAVWHVDTFRRRWSGRYLRLEPVA